MRHYSFTQIKVGYILAVGCTCKDATNAVIKAMVPALPLVQIVPLARNGETIIALKQSTKERDLALQLRPPAFR